LLSFGAESFVFHVAIQKYKDSKIYRIIILPVVLCGCESWSLTLKEEHRLRVFEYWVLRKIFGSKGNEVTGERENNYIMRSLMICTVYPILFGW